MSYILMCRGCLDIFKPLACTEPGELLSPDYEQAEETANHIILDHLSEFHAKHSGHHLIEVEI